MAHMPGYAAVRRVHGARPVAARAQARRFPRISVVAILLVCTDRSSFGGTWSPSSRTRSSIVSGSLNDSLSTIGE